MTYKAFLAELRKLRGTFAMYEHGEILGACGGCPIEEVAVMLDAPATDWRRALDLTPNVRGRIVAAADDWCGSLSPGERRVRRDLLRVLGLKETKA